MTNDTSSALAPRGERGMALIATLLLLLVISGLAAALTTSGRVEVAMGDNEELYAGARAAAESGLNRAAAQILALTNNPAYVLNNLLQGPDGLVDTGNLAATVNADNGLMTHLPDMGGAVPWPVAAGSEYSYDVRLYDDDDPLLNQPSGTPFSTVELAAMAGGPAPQWLPEDGNPVSDVNKRIVIRSTGFGPRGTRVVVEQMLNPIKMPALLVDGDVLIDGQASILGTQGSVHSNEDLFIGSNSVDIEVNATSTGTITVTSNSWGGPGGMLSGGMPVIPVPDIVALNYLSEADFILHDNGWITTRANPATPLCDASTSQNACAGVPPPSPYTSTFGWTFQSGAWSLSQQQAVSATFFAETDVTIEGNTGSTPGPGGGLALTVIAQGDIRIQGTPELIPEPSSELMFVTDKDLIIAGNLISGEVLETEGRIMVREQIHFSGNGTIAGQVIVQNEPDTPDSEIHCPTTDPCNVVTGSIDLHYDGLIETVAYTVAGWRESQ